MEATKMLEPTERIDIAFRSYNRLRNVGDAIMPYVLEELTGFSACAVTPEVPHLLGIGSIFFMATRTSHIWGTGILNPRTNIPDVLPHQITALRGKKTAELLRLRGVALRDIPLGDPGIFAAEVLGNNHPQDQRKYRAAILPHHSSMQHPLFEKVRDSKEFLFVNSLDDTLDPLRRITQCEVVISQSLHGLIFAESLGKPSVWISEQSNDDWQFKFEDWFSMTENPQRAPLPLEVDIEDMVLQAENRACTIDKSALKQALPIATVIHELGKPMGFRECRQIAPITVAVPKVFSGRVRNSFEEVRQSEEGTGPMAFATARSLFSRFAEMTYLCLQPDDDDVPVSQVQLKRMCAWLDQTLTPDSAYILPRHQLPDDAELVEIGDHVAVVSKPTVLGGALLLRPDFAGLSERFITFTV